MNKLTKSNKTGGFNETSRNIQRKSQKAEIHYSNKSLDNFRLIVISPAPTLSNLEKGKKFSESKC